MYIYIYIYIYIIHKATTNNNDNDHNNTHNHSNNHHHHKCSAYMLFKRAGEGLWDSFPPFRCKGLRFKDKLPLCVPLFLVA